MSGSGTPRARSGPGGRTKSGKPRPGTGGHGKRKLEGKGPTPAAELRPGHPRQVKATTRAAARRQAQSGQIGQAGQSTGDAGVTGAGRLPAGRSGASRSGASAEFVAGRNAVLEALRAEVPAQVLHVGPRLDADERIGEAIKLAADHGIKIAEAGRAELDRMTGGAVHQGLALRIRPYGYSHPDELIESAAQSGHPPLIVALDGVTDPRNLGAIARSVAALGADGVLIPVRRSAGVTAGAWKASAGTLARVRVARTPNLARALAGYARAGLFIVGLDARADEVADSLALADGPLVLVVGSEGRGLSRLVAEQCDALVKIPITGTESLNVAVAAGIALYAVSRLRAGERS